MQSQQPALIRSNRQNLLPVPESTMPPDGVSAAFRSLIYPDYVVGRKYKMDQTRADWRGVDPDLKEWAQKYVRRCATLGIPIYVHTAYRSPAIQTMKYVQGTSRAKAGQSAHQYGLAVDAVHSVLAWNMNEDQWLVLHHIAFEVAKSCKVKLVNLNAKGAGKFYDPAHYQVENWKDRIG